MRKLFFILSMFLSIACFSQTIESIIVDPAQLDSTTIAGKKYYILKTALTTTQVNDLNAAKATNTVQDAKIIERIKKDSLQDVAIAAISVPAGSTALRRKITASNYTITQADNGYELWMESKCTINIQPTDGQVLRVRIFRFGDVVSFAPFASVTLTSVTGYKRISANGWADISYYSGNQVRLIGTLTK